MNIGELAKKTVRNVIGLMSGSSCDGIDAALVRIAGTGTKLRFKLLDFFTLPYPEGLQTRLLAPHKNVQEICDLNFRLGHHFADAALQMIERARALSVSVDFIASHGHTVAHIPPRADTDSCGTLQIGESAVIAEKTGLPVVSDFRVRDMAAGGQGAPLVPYVDWLLFHRADRVVACLNIGGIANITVVPPELEQVFAFDTGPGNMIIDAAVRFLSRGELSIDENGTLASRGNVVQEFLDYLLAHPYFDRIPPKSTGREDFGMEVYLRDALSARRDAHPMEDLIATVTTAVAESILRACKRFILPTHKIARLIISGGGAHNTTLVRLLKEGLPDILVRLSDDYRMSSDAKEAIAFAILGNETICGTPANVPGATGASHPVILGKITPS
ncbi:MAG TPA: anhydro-N-acetylmuramic acid kinase [Candidatus Hydrogenedentes bacterium]|nr:anhydro-N-acetylmuramic acid kinase [Candidatus Hydrogenedentota bacterium]HOL77509.1 anhydro-N-acetylmuramic acid kinase [Candidatus Hydrogenedentota bacterium]HPO86612.1 anhydro-N-acetylmuramic acid kinase [Candidatus Hydrogenedentota bacterium]